MTTTQPIRARYRIMAHLRDIGPATKAQLAVELGLITDSTSSILSYMHKGTKRLPKCIYIKSWENYQDGKKNYPRAVYALGQAKDAPKPKPDLLARDRARKAAAQERRRTNFVFNLGTAPKDRK